MTQPNGAMMAALQRHCLLAQNLIEGVQRRTGLADFGEIPFLEGLHTFLHACAEEGDLTLFGLVATRWDIRRFLGNLLQLRQSEMRAPEIAAQPIKRPMFIAGLPRSGTTYLHKLLMHDPANRVPRVWQLIRPYPKAGRHARTDRRQQLVTQQLRLFKLVAPQFAAMHPIDANSPQECSEITAHVFASLRFDTNYSVPGYRRWLEDFGHLDAYRFHKRFLQHLQYQAGGSGSWVLKCPDHVFALAAIRAVYPDARLVLVHRDPARVLLSVARLTEVLRRPFTRRIDRSELGRNESERWLKGAELMMEAADQEPFAEPIHHIHYRDLVRDAVGTVESLYCHFGRSLDTLVAERIRRVAEQNGSAGNGSAGYGLERYQLDAAVLRQRFSGYTARFNIVQEPEASHPRRSDQPAVPSVVGYSGMR